MTDSTTPGKAYYTTADLRLREEPQTGLVKVVMSKGAIVNYLEETRVDSIANPIWYRVTYGRLIGWCSATFLKEVVGSTIPQTPKRVTAAQAVSALAPSYGISLPVALAIMRIESGGVAWGQDGRMIIRLEPHVLQRELNYNPLWHGIFQIGKPTWQGQFHRFNHPTKGWIPFHGYQPTEYEAFEEAIKLSNFCGIPEAAYRSISMGAGQVMGFNCKAVKYSLASKMFNTLKDDAVAQVRAFLDYCRYRSLDDEMARGDFYEFARIYNGSEQAERYARLMEQAAKLNGWVKPT